MNIQDIPEAFGRRMASLVIKRGGLMANLYGSVEQTGEVIWFRPAGSNGSPGNVSFDLEDIHSIQKESNGGWTIRIK